MKNYFLKGKILVLSILLLFACNEDILDKSPLNSYSESIVWSDINLADTYLSRVYDQIKYGYGTTMTGAMTDEMTIGRGPSTQPYNAGTITADRIGSVHKTNSWNQFSNIQRINVFLSNINDIPDNYDESNKIEIEKELEILRGEALFLRAWVYHDIMRSYGGLPLLSEPFTLDDEFLDVNRATFEETINFIVKDCDDAAGMLKLKSETEMGRATKEAALALKSRVLLFAASDLTADGTATNELVGYTNPDRTLLWTSAKNAAKAVIDLGTCKLSDFGAPDKDAVAENYFRFFAARNLSDDEVIWGRMFLPDIGAQNRMNYWCGPNGYGGAGRNGPIQQMVDSYQMIDGSDFSDHFTLNENNEYINISNKFTNENPYYFRDPRFYGSILYDSAKYYHPRFEDLIQMDPLGIFNRRTRIVIENGVVVSSISGLDTRQGPRQPHNGNYSGYVLKKFSDPLTVAANERNENIFIFIRYAEILLNYAEASLELGDETTATQYINLIRNRAAMPNFTGNIKDALRLERKIELFGEDNRWYDIRRWKILLDVLDMTPGGIEIMEITEDGETTTTWKRIGAQSPNNPHEKMYWLPIDTEELKRAPQLEQNPGY